MSDSFKALPLSVLHHSCHT